MIAESVGFGGPGSAGASTSSLGDSSEDHQDGEDGDGKRDGEDHDGGAHEHHHHHTPTVTSPKKQVTPSHKPQGAHHVDDSFGGMSEQKKLAWGGTYHHTHL